MKKSKERNPSLYSFLVLALTAASLLLGSCSTSDGRKYKPVTDFDDWTNEPIPVSGNEASEYRAIQNLYSRKAYDQSQVRIRAFIKRFPRSQIIARIYNLNGLIYLHKERSLQAVHWFRKALNSAAQGSFKQFVRYNLASAYYDANKYKNAHRTVVRIDPQALDPKTRLKFHYLKSVLYLHRKKNNESARETLASSYLFETISSEPHLQRRVHTMFERHLSQVLAKIQDEKTIEEFLTNYEDSPLADVLHFRLGEDALKGRRVSKAEGHFKSLVSQFPESDHYIESVDYLRTLQNQKVVDPKAIGVLLPLTGRFAKFGSRSLKGIELAFRIFNTNEPDSKVTLILEDAGETPEEAIEALNRLYFDHHVVAVIGPLLSKGVEQVAERAEDLGLPMITLAQQGPKEEGKFVFQSAITPKDQAWEIARFAIKNRGMRRFAILHPKDKFGWEYTHHFWDAVEEMGGEVVGIESYPSGETDYRVFVEKLGGLYYKNARKREIEALAEVRREMNITRRTHKTEQYYVLPPIIDFDAVFIPDESKAIGQILPTFAYEDIEGITFLGIPTWYSERLAKRNPDLSNNVFFVSSYYENSPSAVIQNFNSRFKNTYELKPGTLEALAYDAAVLLEHTLVTAENDPGRSEIQDKLNSIVNFPGVTGQITAGNGQMLRRLKVLQFENRTITEAL